MFSKMEKRLNIFLDTQINLVPLIQVEETSFPAAWKNKRVSTLSKEGVIQQLWEMQSKKNSAVVSLLQENIIDIYFAKRNNSNFYHGICYIFQNKGNQGNLSCWFAPFPVNKDNAIYKSILSESYKDFLLIHNGFYIDGNSAIGFFPLEKLHFLSTGNNVDSLLAFCGDSLGNLRCFDFSKRISENEYFTVDWDHELEETSDNQEFWDFTYNFCKKMMGA